MLGECWAAVCDGGPTYTQHCLSVLCLLGCHGFACSSRREGNYFSRAWWGNPSLLTTPAPSPRGSPNNTSSPVKSTCHPLTPRALVFILTVCKPPNHVHWCWRRGILKLEMPVFLYINMKFTLSNVSIIDWFTFLLYIQSLYLYEVNP